MIPDDTWANPLVGSEAGHPITKFAGAERRVLADEDLAGVDETVEHIVELESRSTTTWRCSAANSLATDDRGVEIVDDHAPTVGSERCAGRVGANAGQQRQLAVDLDVDGVGERRRRGQQHDRRVDAVLGLDQQVGGEQRRVGGVVGDHEALGRAEQHHRRHAVALHLDLGDA